MYFVIYFLDDAVSKSLNTQENYSSDSNSRIAEANPEPNVDSQNDILNGSVTHFL